LSSLSTLQDGISLSERKKAERRGEKDSPSLGSVTSLSYPRIEDKNRPLTSLELVGSPKVVSNLALPHSPRIFETRVDPLRWSRERIEKSWRVREGSGICRRVRTRGRRSARELEFSNAPFEGVVFDETRRSVLEVVHSIRLCCRSGSSLSSLSILRSCI
jgi:hypothetical protein